ncbi:hypothetical protein GCM10010954_11710 [Halobacillus andaensis]|uniref:Sporulation protein n=1 Tax=Halobacillus andaensis TaxID=1176239 RepID=A0A917EW50_HALAA|nr:sporulation protein [Halobacillus andaensis]MBP2003968.1 sporulation-control protein [Halobacillus andaensis]GGF14797.1 hypothetical protein GCM10010954_11710 [Halobacillus andaensis]
MINRVLSILKIGTPRVDLVLDTQEIVPGEKLFGAFHLYGGWRTCKIRRLECDLVITNLNEKTQVVEPIKTVLMSQVMKPKERREISFHYCISSNEIPLRSEYRYHLKTRVVFENNVKTFDHDELTVAN